MGSILKGFGLHTSKRTGHRPTLFDRHPGQAIVLIAVLMIVLLGFTGLAVDGGELYFLQKNLQNAADAAVLAGLYEICSDPSRLLEEGRVEALGAATQAINDNGFYDGVDGTTIVITHPADPGTGLTYNYFVVDITARKPARLIQLVYQGPLQVTVRAAGRCTPTTEWAYGAALIGMGTCSGNGAGQDAVSYSPSTTINGGIMSNGDIAGNGGTINGDLNAVGSIDGNGNTYGGTTNTGQPYTNFPQIWDMEDFEPGGKTAEWAAGKSPTAYFYANGNADEFSDFNDGGSTPSNSNPPDGIYYASGDITLGNPDFNGLPSYAMNGKTFVAGGQIQLQVNAGNYQEFVYYDPLPGEESDAGYSVLPLAFTMAGNQDCGDNNADYIDIGSAFNFLGVLYAPNAECVFTGSDGVSSNGAIVCFKVNLSGGDFSLTYDPDVFPPIPPQVGVTG